jgi:hypothetical protein
MKGLKWGVLIGSVIMTLAIGPQPYWSENPPPFLVGNLIASTLFFYGLPIIAGIVAGAITRGSGRKNVLAGALCAIPATAVYWYVIEVAHIGDGIITPIVLVVTAGLGAIGGLISYGIQSLKRLTKREPFTKDFPTTTLTKK